MTKDNQFWHHNCPDSGETATEKGKPCNWCNAVETQPEQEPVAWMDIDEKGFGYGLRYWSEPDNRHEVPLYTTPPQRKPLTDEEIEEVWRRVQANDFHDCVQPFARAIEAAHGIKE